MSPQTSSNQALSDAVADLRYAARQAQTAADDLSDAAGQLEEIYDDLTGNGPVNGPALRLAKIIYDIHLIANHAGAHRYCRTECRLADEVIRDA